MMIMMIMMIMIVMMMMMMNGWLLSLPAVVRKLWSMLVKVNKYAIIFSFPFSNAIMTTLFPIGIIMIVIMIMIIMMMMMIIMMLMMTMNKCYI